MSWDKMEKLLAEGAISHVKGIKLIVKVILSLSKAALYWAKALKQLGNTPLEWDNATIARAFTAMSRDTAAMSWDKMDENEGFGLK